MVQFLPVTRPMEGGETKGQGVGFIIFNLPLLLNTLYLSRRENPPSSRGSEDEERHMRNSPLDHGLLTAPFQPQLFQTEAQPQLLQTEARIPPRLKRAWSLGKETDPGEEHKAGTWRFHSPIHLNSKNKINLVHFKPGENCHWEKSPQL